MNDLLDQKRVLGKIESYILTLKTCLENSREPDLFLPGNTQKMVKFSRRNSTLFPDFICLLREIYTLVKMDNYCTKRSLYYKYRNRYGSQSRVDFLVKMACEVLQEYREALHILATSKGLIFGDLVIETRDGELLDCRTVTAVPQFSGDVKVRVSSAKYVLVVEKDSIFEKLVTDNFTSVLGSGVLITAKGYPDFSTRVLLRILQSHLKVPFFALMDADPNGIEIYLTYKHGSCHSDSCEAENPCLPTLLWIGVYPCEIESLQLKSNHRIKLTRCEKKKISCMRQRLENYEDPLIDNQLEFLRNIDSKVEIEALCSENGNYLVHTYLKTKFRNFC